MIPHTVFSSLPQLLMVCGVLAVAAGVYVALGFGAGMIAVGALALVMPEIQDVVVMLLLLGLPAELCIVSRSWRSIHWRGLLLILAAVAVGIPAGGWLLRWGEPTFLLGALGGFLVLAGGAFLVLPVRAERQLPGWLGAPVGLSSGLLTGLFGAGGPPLIFYYQLSGVPKAVFRGSLMAIFLAMTAVRLPVYLMLGLITQPRLLSALAVLPAAILGAWLGHRIHLELDEARFKQVVSIALVAIGILLLAGRA